jgi:hypothetical protein
MHPKIMSTFQDLSTFIAFVNLLWNDGLAYGP